MNIRTTRSAGLAAATLSIFLWGCEAQPPSPPAAAADTSAPVIRDVVLNRNPNLRAPLAAIMSLSTDEPTEMTVRIDDGERTWDATSSDGYATEHSLSVLGMRPGRMHRITAVVSDESGNFSETRPLPMEMPPLPPDLAQPELVMSDPARMEPGVTLFNIFALGPAGEPLGDFDGVLYIVDERGDVIWYYRSELDMGDARRLSNGNLLFNAAADSLVLEIDMLGNIVQQWHAVGTATEVPEGSTPVNVDTLHHEVSEMPSGNLLALSSELRLIDDYPTSETDPDADPGPASVIGDVVVEFSRDGAIVREWKLLDLLDPHRITYGSLEGGYWTSRYEGLIGDIDAEPPIRDWSHSNAVIYDASDDSYIVSVRHQDAVIKIDRDTGELVWILGPPDHWREPWSTRRLQPVGELEWQYHQHGPTLTADGTFVLFDNGNFRVGAFEERPPAAQQYSLAVEFAADTDSMSVEQVWSYGGTGDEPFFSSYVSDADWLPVTGNILITDGARETTAAGAPAEPGAAADYWARIVEVTHTQPAEKVFELHVRNGGAGRWHIYRGQRLPSLYP